MGDNGEIIILSDDEDDDIFCNDPSVLIVEVDNVKKSDFVFSQAPLDEDLVVTYSKRAEVLPHARYDCPIHPFTATDREVNGPVDSNQLICDQCFCYICDKLASECSLWCYTGMCHCNSHKRSEFWNNHRSIKLLGGLKTFKLTLSEIDAHLRYAETMLQSFKQELRAIFSTFLKGKPFQAHGINGIVYDYTQVYEFVSSFLNEADKMDNRAAAIMRLGAAEEFIRHFQSSEGIALESPLANAYRAKVLLLQRVISAVQRHIVMSDFTSDFANKLQDFYTTMNFPAELKSMRNSLRVRPWHDVLLVSVLKGQNVSGVRKEKGKKDVLIEQISIVFLRTEFLQQQNRYKELSRYLRIVQIADSNLFQPLRDLVPFFMCMHGDFSLACDSLFQPGNVPASRFTPLLFCVYLRIFETATAPKLVVSQPSELCCTNATWEPIKDAVPLKHSELVKFAFRAQKCCPAVFIDSQCWISLLTVVNKPCDPLTAMPAPSPQFLHDAKDVVSSILLQQDGMNIQIPKFFQEMYPDQALLLLVSGALRLRILSAALSPVLPVLNTFKENLWALRWLWDTLSSNKERLTSFIQEITQEMQATATPTAIQQLLISTPPK